MTAAASRKTRVDGDGDETNCLSECGHPKRMTMVRRRAARFYWTMDALSPHPPAVRPKGRVSSSEVHRRVCTLHMTQ